MASRYDVYYFLFISIVLFGRDGVGFVENIL
jgi:hypothetical protein